MTFARRVERRPVLTRWLLAGPGAVVAAILSMVTMPFWLPGGAAGIDHLVFPIVLFPVIWAIVFFYFCLTEELARAVGVLVFLVVAQAGLVALSFAN